VSAALCIGIVVTICGDVSLFLAGCSVGWQRRAKRDRPPVGYFRLEGPSEMRSTVLSEWLLRYIDDPEYRAELDLLVSLDFPSPSTSPE
jgi:hypothetical protein